MRVQVRQCLFSSFEWEVCKLSALAVVVFAGALF